MAIKEKETSISVMEIVKGQMDFCVLGTSPLICNRMSEKAKRELLMPKGRKNAAEKASSLKHDPVAEYRASPYVSRDPASPTLLMVMASAFKKALSTAALDMPGAKKAQIGRLTYVEGDYIPIYGTPRLFMSITRSADMNKTPDVRTRAILREWACRVSITFVKPQLREQAVANLLAAAGITMGIGDWRPEKGAGSYGQFRLVSQDDAEFVRIIQTQGRIAQVASMDEPEPYDAESAELLSWFETESKVRGFKVPA